MSVNMNGDPQAFGEWVYSQRMRIGVSRRTLGEKVGVSPEYIRILEMSRRTPSNVIRVALTSVLDGSKDFSKLPDVERRQVRTATTALTDKEDLSRLIYISLPEETKHGHRVADQMASMLIKAGYRRVS